MYHYERIFVPVSAYVDLGILQGNVVCIRSGVHVDSVRGCVRVMRETKQQLIDETEFEYPDRQNTHLRMLRGGGACT